MRSLTHRLRESTPARAPRFAKYVVSTSGKNSCLRRCANCETRAPCCVSPNRQSDTAPRSELFFDCSAPAEHRMTLKLDVFDDFHVHGASAPEWNQRYLQVSPGAMHSSLVEVTADRIHVFRKWMSERVIQQGCLPKGKICFA